MKNKTVAFEINHPTNGNYIEYPDCPGCNTFVDDTMSKEEKNILVQEAFKGWHETMVSLGKSISKFSVDHKAPKYCIETYICEV